MGSRGTRWRRIRSRMRAHTSPHAPLAHPIAMNAPLGRSAVPSVAQSTAGVGGGGRVRGGKSRGEGGKEGVGRGESVTCRGCPTNNRGIRGAVSCGRPVHARLPPAYWACSPASRAVAVRAVQEARRKRCRVVVGTAQTIKCVRARSGLEGYSAMSTAYRQIRVIDPRTESSRPVVVAFCGLAVSVPLRDRVCARREA